MSTQKPAVSVILLNYYDLKNTLECIASLQDVKIVVVNMHDDDRGVSDDGKEIHAKFPEVSVIESENLGFSGGNNLGAAFAMKHHNPDYLLFLNNDTRVDSRAIYQLVTFAEGHKGELGAYAPKIYFAPGYEFHQASYSDAERGKVLWYAGGLVDRINVYAWHRGVDEVDRGQFDTPTETAFLTGCCMLISAQTYRSIGSWNTKYFLYLEDLEYSMRIKRGGGKLWYVPDAKVWHKNASSNGGSGSAAQVYYQTRNRLYFGLRFAPLRTKIALVKNCVKNIFYGTQIEKEASIDGLMGKMGKRIIRRRKA